MDLSEAIGAVEGARSVVELRSILQTVAEAYGFASYAFVDASPFASEDPLILMTNPASWDRTYRSENLVGVDPVLAAARRTNMPFTWSGLRLPERIGKRLPGALKTMFAARDHGFKDGLVIPFHYVDRLGRPFSSVCTFFWTQASAEMTRRLLAQRRDLHMIMLYWAQAAVDLSSYERRRPSRMLNRDGEPLGRVRLTDRERDCIAWAARGKTISETSDILSIGEATVNTHLANAIAKLGASTKTEAATRALYLGLIDY